MAAVKTTVETKYNVILSEDEAEKLLAVMAKQLVAHPEYLDLYDVLKTALGIRSVDDIKYEAVLGSNGYALVKRGQ